MDTVYIVSTHQAEYKGTLTAFYNQVAADLKYPKTARRQGVQGKIFVAFIIDKLGSLKYAWVAKGIGAGCDEAALDAVKQRNAWSAGHHNEKPVDSIMILPISFRLER